MKSLLSMQRKNKVPLDYLEISDWSHSNNFKVRDWLASFWAVLLFGDAICRASQPQRNASHMTFVFG